MHHEQPQAQHDRVALAMLYDAEGEFHMSHDVAETALDDVERLLLLHSEASR